MRCKSQKDDYQSNFTNRLQALYQEIEPVIKAAGIEEKLKDAELPSAGEAMQGLSIPLWDREGLDRQSVIERKGRRRRIRDVIFGVEDSDFRKKLISYFRKVDDLSVEYLRHDLWEKQQNLRELQSSGFKLIFRGAIAGGVTVGIAALANLAIGLGFLAFAVIAAIYDIKHREEKRHVAVREAGAEITELRADIKRCLELGSFSLREEIRSTSDEAEAQRAHAGADNATNG